MILVQILTLSHLDQKIESQQYDLCDNWLPLQREGAFGPKVTIVTPSFNQGQYLEETIKSVLSQGYINLEYIIIDGGSTDNSVEIIRKYEPWLAYWVSEPDYGQADAINKGFRISTGEYLGWINSDDTLCTNSIKRVMDAFGANPNIDMIYGDVLQGPMLGPGSTSLLGQRLEFTEMLRTLQVPIPQQGCLWKRTVIDRCGYLDARWQVVLDREFFTRVVQKCEIYYLPGVLGFFRIHEYSKSVSQSRRWLTELPQMYRDFFEQRDLPVGLRKLQRETMGVVHLTCASIAYQSGEIISSTGYLFKAFWMDPLFLFRRYARSKMAKLLLSNLPKAQP